MNIHRAISLMSMPSHRTPWDPEAIRNDWQGVPRWQPGYTMTPPECAVTISLGSKTSYSAR